MRKIGWGIFGVVVLGCCLIGAGVFHWRAKEARLSASAVSPEQEARLHAAQSQLASRGKQGSAEEAEAATVKRQRLAEFEAEVARARAGKDAGQLFELAQRIESTAIP